MLARSLGLIGLFIVASSNVSFGALIHRDSMDNARFFREAEDAPEKVVSSIVDIAAVKMINDPAPEDMFGDVPTIFILDAEFNRVIWNSYDLDSGRMVEKPLGAFGSGPDQFLSPVAIAATSKGQVAVVDESAHIIKLFHYLPTSGVLQFKSSVGGQGSEPGKFRFPSDVAFEKQFGDLFFIADTHNRRIQIFDFGVGNFFGQFGQSELTAPISVEVGLPRLGGELPVYVVDAEKKLIQFNQNGVVKRTFHSRSISSHAIFGKVGVSISGKVCVADPINNLIYEFTADLEFLGSSSGSTFDRFSSLRTVTGDISQRSDRTLFSFGQLHTGEMQKWSLFQQAMSVTNLRLIPKESPLATDRFEMIFTEAGNARLRVLDTGGNVVRRLYEGSVSPGRFMTNWDSKGDGGERLPAGFYTLEVHAIDIYGNSAVRLLPIEVPGIVINTGNFTNNNRRLAASWRPDDPAFAVTEYMYGIGTSPGATNVFPLTSVGLQTSVSVDFSTPLSDGLYYWAVSARNSDGKTVTDDEQIIVDTASPDPPFQLTADGASPGPWKNMREFLIDWVNPSDLSGIVGAFSKIASTPTNSSDGAFSTSKPFNITVPPTEGLHQVYLWLKDNAGNASEIHRSTVTLRFDITPPSITDLKALPFSPNEDGQKDSAVIDYSLVDNFSQRFKVTIQILDEFGDEMKKVVDAGERSLGANSDLWDGRDNNGRLVTVEGLYRVQITAVDEAGNRRTVNGTVLVDLTPPDVSNSALHVRPGATPGVFTTKDKTIDVSLDYIDNSATSTVVTAVFRTIDSETVQRRSFSTVAGASETFTIVWDGKGSSGNFMKDGTYAVTLTATDDAGNTSDPVTTLSAFGIDLLPSQITALYADTPLFTPDDRIVGNNDKVTFFYQLADDATVVLNIKDNLGQTIVSETRASKAGVLESLVWDGVLSTGSVVNDGLYILHLKTIDAVGNEASGTVPVVKNQVPAQFTFPLAQLTKVGGSVVLKGIAIDPLINDTTGFSNYSLWFRLGQGLDFNLAENNPASPDPFAWTQVSVPMAYQSPTDVNYPNSNVSQRSILNSVLAVWDARHLTIGSTYTVLLSVQDKAGNISFDRKEVLIDPSADGTAPLVQLTSPAPSADILLGSINDRVSIAYSLVQALEKTADVSVEIFRVDSATSFGPVVFQSVFPRQTKGSTFLWDGRDSGGKPVSDGRYRIKITATDNDGLGASGAHIDVNLTIQFAAPLKVLNFSASKDIIGIEEMVSVSYVLNKQAAVTLRAFDAAGQLAASFDATNSSGATTWNTGTAGVYRWDLQAVSVGEPQTQASASFPITVTSAGIGTATPAITGTNPEAVNGAVRGVSNFTWTATAAGEHYPPQDFSVGVQGVGSHVLSHPVNRHSAAGYHQINLNDADVTLAHYFEPNFRFVPRFEWERRTLYNYHIDCWMEPRTGCTDTETFRWSAFADPNSLERDIVSGNSISQVEIIGRGNHHITLRFTSTTNRRRRGRQANADGFVYGNVRIDRSYWEGANVFFLSGEIESIHLPYDANLQPRHIYWDASVPSGAEIWFQLTTGNTGFVGPDGSPNSWYKSSGQPIWPGHAGSFLRWKARLITHDRVVAPRLRGVEIRSDWAPKATIQGKAWYNHPFFSANLEALLPAPAGVFRTDPRFSFADGSATNENVAKRITVENGIYQVKGETTVKESWSSRDDMALLGGEIIQKFVPFNNDPNPQNFTLEAPFDFSSARLKPVTFISGYAQPNMSDAGSRDKYTFHDDGFGRRIDNPFVAIDAQRRDWSVRLSYPNGDPIDTLIINHDLAKTSNQDREPSGTPIDANDDFSVILATGAVPRVFVEIRGNTSAEGFQSYAMFYRKSSETVFHAIQIQNSTKAAANNGTLAYWDVTGLHGDYVLKLIVFSNSGVNETTRNVTLGTLVPSTSSGPTFVNAPHNKAFLEFPTGALENDTVVTITPRHLKDTPLAFDLAMPQPIGTVYDLQPKGIRFRKNADGTVIAPASLTMRFLPNELKGIDPGQLILYRITEDGVLQSLDARAVVEDGITKITSPVTEFSFFLALSTVVPPVIDAIPSITNQNHLRVLGTADPTAAIEIFVNGALAGQTRALANGRFEFDAPLVEGNNLVTARARLKFGIGEHRLERTSALGSTQEIISDTIPPAIEGIIAAPSPFSPFEEQISTMSFVLSETSFIDVSVKGPHCSSPCGRNLMINQRTSAGQVSAAWDGKDDGGRFADFGDFLITLQARDLAANMTEKQIGVVMTPPLPPVADIRSPLAGQRFIATKSTLTVDFSVTDNVDPNPSFAAYLVDLEEGTTVPTRAGQTFNPLDLDDGFWSLKIDMTDKFGNSTQAVSGPFEIIHDIRPPRTTLHIGFPRFASVNALFVSTQAELSFSAVDDLITIGDGLGLGVDKTLFSRNNEPFKTFSSAFALTEGIHTIRYQSVDVLGNTEVIQSTQVFSDGTPPVSTAFLGQPRLNPSFDQPFFIVSGKTPIAIVATDPISREVASGVKDALYRTDSASLFIVQISSFSLSGPDGVKTVEFFSQDQVANQELAQATRIGRDGTPPVSSLTLLGSRFRDVQNRVFVSTTTGLLLTAADPVVNGVVSKVDQIRFSVNIDFPNRQPFSSTITLTEGIRHVEFNAIDRVQNEEAMRIETLSVDGTAPQTTISIGDPQFAGAEAGSLFISTETSITFGAEDPLGRDFVASGVKNIFVRFTSSAPEVAVELQRMGLPTDQFKIVSSSEVFRLPEGITTIQAFSEDNVDNVGGVVSQTVRVDASPPISSLSIGQPQFRRGESSPLLVSAKTPFAITVIDPIVREVASGVEKTFFRIAPTTQASFVEHTSAFTLSPPDGIHAVEFFSVDRVKNEEAVQRMEVELDSTPPEAALTSPSPEAQGVDQVFNGIVSILGTATDAHFASYRVEFTTGTDPTHPFSLIFEATSEVFGGQLARWDTTGLAGFYLLRLVVTDQVENQSVVTATVFIGQPKPTLVFGELPGMNHPHGVAISPSPTPSPLQGEGDIRIWVADTNNDLIRQFDGQGKIVQTIGVIPPPKGPPPNDPLAFNKPHSVALQSSPPPSPFQREGESAIWVADTNNHRVVKLSTNGVVLQELGKRNPSGKFFPGADPGQFNHPADVALGPDGSLYVADRQNGRVQAFASDGIFLRAIQISTDAPNPPQPYSVFVDGGGFLYVTDQANDRLLKMDTSGKVLLTMTGFAMPQDAAVSPRRFIYVADRNNDRIVKFSPDGNVAGVFGAIGQTEGLFNKPTGLSISSDGSLAVADRNNSRIQTFSVPGSAVGGSSAALPAAAGPVAQSFGPDPAFRLGEVYAYPNPARNGRNPIIHIEVGVADSVDIRIYDVAGDLVHQGSVYGVPQVINDGQGPQYAYEYRWDTSGVASGIYVYVIHAHKNGESDLKKISKVALIK